MGLADDRHFCLHMLRHTAATRVLDTTGRLEVVQKVLGHSKIATTQRYAHLSDATLLDAVRRTAEKHGLAVANT
jgi:site-specific recombinase XerD